MHSNTMPSSLSEFLRKVPLFSEVPVHDLAELVEECNTEDLEPGAVLFSEGESGDAAYVVMSGHIDIVKSSGSREVLLNSLSPGDVFGEMALLDDAPRMAGAKANGQSTVVRIHKEQVQNLLEKSRPVQTAMFGMVLDRLKSTQAQLQQSERMVQLGTLAAGIAHELNNPASAAKRAADQLHEAVTMLGDAFSDFAASAPSAATVERAKILIAEAQKAASGSPEIDSLERSDAEADLDDWLEDQGVANPWDVSSDLVTAGIGRSELDELANTFDPQTSTQLARLLARVVSVTTLLESVGQASHRVSDIVDAMRSYSFLDQGPTQRVDVRVGLRDALAVMGAAIPQGVTVSLDFADDLPEIDAHGSELNQVWTNLITNALDAVSEKGVIEITASGNVGGGVTVQIMDSGHGIPSEIQDRVFDAFFTTKEPGSGTGLGLHAAYDIVVNKHNGNISLTSEPGHTNFRVDLPPDLGDRNQI